MSAPDPVQTFYDAVGGHPTFEALVHRFYQGVAGDGPLRALYPEEDLGPAQERLTESVLDRDVIVRYHTISALNRLGQAHPERSTDRKLIEAVLAAA